MSSQSTIAPSSSESSSDDLYVDNFNDLFAISNSGTTRTCVYTGVVSIRPCKVNTSVREESSAAQSTSTAAHESKSSKSLQSSEAY